MWIIMEMIYIYIYICKVNIFLKENFHKKRYFWRCVRWQIFLYMQCVGRLQAGTVKEKKSTPHHFCEHTTLKEIVSSNWHSHCAAHQQLYWKISELQMLMQHTIIWINDILMWGEKKCMNNDSEKLWKKPQTCLAKAGYSSSPQSPKLL